MSVLLDPLATIRADRIVAIVRVDRPDDGIAEALAAGGIRAIEVSLLSRGALPAIAHWADRYGNALVIGAGTVVTAEQACAAVSVGARYLVSPCYDEEVDAEARAAGVLYVAGALTPTEVQRALAAGHQLVKLFPAERLGPGYVRDLLGPFPHAALVPTGGIDLDNARAFLDAGAAAIAVGSSLVRVGVSDEELAETAARFRRLTSTSEGVDSHAR